MSDTVELQSEVTNSADLPAHLFSGAMGACRLTTVEWTSAEPEDASVTVVTGEATVEPAMEQAYTFMIVSGIMFQLEGAEAGESGFRFSYEGQLSAEVIHEVVHPGVEAILSSE